MMRETSSRLPAASFTMNSRNTVQIRRVTEDALRHEVDNLCDLFTGSNFHSLSQRTHSHQTLAKSNLLHLGNARFSIAQFLPSFNA